MIWTLKIIWLKSTQPPLLCLLFGFNFGRLQNCKLLVVRALLGIMAHGNLRKFKIYCSCWQADYRHITIKTLEESMLYMMLVVNRSNRSNHDYLLWKTKNHDLAILRLNANSAYRWFVVAGVAFFFLFQITILVFVLFLVLIIILLVLTVILSCFKY